MAHPSLPLVVTVGGSASDSYLTLEEAEHYHESHRNFNTGWINLNDDESKSRAILWAMAILESRIKWNGRKADAKQSLAWPRYYAYDDDGYLLGYDYTNNVYILPEKLKWAVAELAYQLILKDRTADPDSKGLNSLSVDVIKLDFSTSDVAKTIPESVMGLLINLGTLKGPGAATVQLVRT